MIGALRGSGAGEEITLTDTEDETEKRITQKILKKLTMNTSVLSSKTPQNNLEYIPHCFTTQTILAHGIQFV
jgi:hypothetical protein